MVINIIPPHFHRYLTPKSAFLASRKLLSILGPSSGTACKTTQHCVIFFAEFEDRQGFGIGNGKNSFYQDCCCGSEVSIVGTESTLQLFHHGGCFMSPGCQLTFIPVPLSARMVRLRRPSPKKFS